MELSVALHQRRSVRSYTEQPVSADTLKQLIDNAILAPSASHSQPWAFGIVAGRQELLELSTRAKDYALANLQDHPTFQPYVGALQNARFNLFYGAPVLLVIYANRKAPSPQGDAAMAAQNVMLSAYEAGLGTCWIGLALPYLNSSAFKQSFSLPEEMVAVAPIIVGYPESVPEKPERKAPVILFGQSSLPAFAAP